MSGKMTWREFTSEFLGTLVLLFFADGIVAAGVFYQGWHSFVELALITGLGVTLGIYVAAPNSQAHLNPAITLAMAAWRDFPKGKIIPYILAQVSGAFSGAFITYILYWNSIASFQESGKTVPQFFYTGAAPGLGNLQAVFVEIILTLILTVVIFSITDPANKTIPQGPWGALIIGLAVALLGSTFGHLTGFAMNPARDFGPRLFADIAGWSSSFKENGYFWVPLLGPVIGAGFGGLLYEKVLRKQASGAFEPSAQVKSAIDSPNLLTQLSGRVNRE